MMWVMSIAGAMSRWTVNGGESVFMHSIHDLNLGYAQRGDAPDGDTHSPARQDRRRCPLGRARNVNTPSTGVGNPVEWRSYD